MFEPISEMTSYEVGQLSALISSSSSVSGKRKNKAKKLQLLFSTPLPNHKNNVEKSTTERAVENKQFNAFVSPIEKDNRNVKKKHKDAKETKTTFKEKERFIKNDDTEVAHDRTKENENHLQKDICTSGNVVDVKENVVKTKKRKRGDSESSKEIINIDDAKNARTIFIGNLPTSVDREELKHLFKQFGKIESARIRSAAAPKASMPKKVAVIKQKYHPGVHCFNGFVVFETKEMAHAALELNGVEIEGHHVRVDIANRNQEHDHRRSVFVGNLPFDIQDDDLWDFFQECGEVRQVRTIRDKETRIGKGFGYILFKTMDEAALALEKNGEKLNGRPLRISRSMKKERKLSKGKLSKGKLSAEACKKLHANKAYQGTRAKERLRLKKNKKIAKNRLRLKRKKILAEKLQSSLIKASGR